MPSPHQPLLKIVFEDELLFVLDKPPDLVCHPTKGDETSSLVGRIRLYRHGQPAFLINRLDRETSGLVVAAKDPDTAAELGRVWSTRSVVKEYFAVVHGFVTADSGLIDGSIGPDTASAVAIKGCVRPDGAPAQTEFWVEARDAATCRSLLRVRPLTGRKHQIRIHLSHRGHPVVGDKIYGPDEHIYLRFIQGGLTEGDKDRLVTENQALQACALRFTVRGVEREFRLPLESRLGALLTGCEAVEIPKMGTRKSH